MPTLRTATLGCKVNQYETELLREGLLGAGYLDAAKDEAADVCVVNTCTVTAEGDSKSRQTIRQLARRNPEARIVVMGCYATRAPEEISALPGVVEVVTDKRELPDLMGRFGVVDVPTGVSGLSGRHRAYVKVQDGCLLRCSFCIIPKVRPDMYSRPMDEIVEEVHRLIDNDYREIVLTGIHLGHYGVDFNRSLPKSQWTRLSHLVERIVALPGDFRVRLSSIEATEVTRELIDVMAEHADRVCPHLHISMQSGSDTVLRRMRRRWGSQRYVDRCRLLQDRLDHPAITTDIIVGFPGETDAEFEQTCEVAREVGFSKIHIFPFSARRGTPAAEFDGQLPKHVKQQRARQLAALEAELRDEYFASLIGRQLRVLVEGPSKSHDGGMTGTACRYAPVEMSGEQDRVGEFVKVEASQVVDGRIVC
jgi:threonylcarbamoyladenosine tRNA methylthiotransferase MtaB